MPDDYHFPGWESPTTTPVPDQLFDELLARGVLSDPELRVLLYIIRRTYGFKKDSDRISLSQITGGIVTRKGKRLDGGAGVGKTAAVKAVQGLEAKGIILAERTSSAAHGNEPTTYRLRPRPVFTARTPPVRRANTAGARGSHPPVHAANTQETDGQQTVRQEGDAEFTDVDRRVMERTGLSPAEYRAMRRRTD